MGNEGTLGSKEDGLYHHCEGGYISVHVCHNQWNCVVTIDEL